MSSDTAARRPVILKAVVTLHALGVFAQAVFAGQFMSGSDAAVKFHEINGWILLGICLMQIVLAFRMKAAPLWFPISTVLIFLFEGLQIGTGYGRFLGVHVPLAILTFGGVLAQAVWVVTL
jgi:hypothetical protein